MKECSYSVAGWLPLSLSPVFSSSGGGGALQARWGGTTSVRRGRCYRTTPRPRHGDERGEKTSKHRPSRTTTTTDSTSHEGKCDGTNEDIFDRRTARRAGTNGARATGPTEPGPGRRALRRVTRLNKAKRRRRASKLHNGNGEERREEKFLRKHGERRKNKSFFGADPWRTAS